MLLLLLILSSECSGVKIPLRVYGGDDADQKKYPYVVRIEKQYSTNLSVVFNEVFVAHIHLCSASALSSTWVLTAAHCIANLIIFIDRYPYTTVKLVIRYGNVHSKPSDKNTFSDVVSTVVHPMYTNAFTEHKSKWLKNDIGLVKTTPMTINTYMKLSPVDFYTLYGHEALSAGFGITTEVITEGEIKTDNTLVLQKPLQIFKAVIIKCPRNVPLVPSLCLAQRCSRKVMVCGGDSGGPLIHESGIVGLLSMGYETGYCLNVAKKIFPDYSGIIFPISPYIEWIYSYVRT